MAGVQKMKVQFRGEVIERAIDFIDCSVPPGQMPRPTPVLSAGEHLLHFVGSDVPVIIETGAAFAASRVSKYGY